ncbi:MAG TPA: hypothetical protein VF600_04660 [Abditibacteriaceae bacterium]|jgi:hypothetical protein
MSTQTSITRGPIIVFAALLSTIVALCLASLTRLFTYLTIGFNTHNQEPWLSTREVVTIIGVDTVTAFIVAFTASRVLLLVNRVLKLPPKLASGLPNIVFVSMGIALIVTFVQGFKEFGIY